MMKLLTLVFIFSQFAQAECYRGDLKDGAINGVRSDAQLFFQRSGSAGGRGGIAIEDKKGRRVFGDVRCAGGAPDDCRFGTDGGTGKFQFIDNRPTIVLQKGKLAAIGGDEESDLRVVKDQHGFNYPMEIVSDISVCKEYFPQAEEPVPGGVPHVRPAVQVPASR